jgi:hypothetical protein
MSHHDNIAAPWAWPFRGRIVQEGVLIRDINLNQEIPGQFVWLIELL